MFVQKKRYAYIYIYIYYTHVIHNIYIYICIYPHERDVIEMGYNGIGVFTYIICTHDFGITFTSGFE